MTNDIEGCEDETKELWGGRCSGAEEAEELLEAGKNVEAAARARMALQLDEDPETDRLEALIEASGEPPEGWREALDAFAEEPSIEEWDRLLEFIPTDTAYTRVRHAVRYLEAKDVSPNMLFRISSRGGIVPDALRLVDSGDVDAVTVLERADEAPETVRGSWFAIAARAHFAQDNIFGAVRLLERALDVTYEPSMVDMHARKIWDEADEEAREQIRPVWSPSSSSLWSED